MPFPTRQANGCILQVRVREAVLAEHGSLIGALLQECIFSYEYKGWKMMQESPPDVKVPCCRFKPLGVAACQLGNQPE